MHKLLVAVICVLCMQAGFSPLQAQSIGALPSQVYRGQSVGFYISGVNFDFSSVSGSRLYRTSPNSGLSSQVNFLNSGGVFVNFYLSPNATLGPWNIDLIDFSNSPVAPPDTIQVLAPPAGAGRITGSIFGAAACNSFNSPVPARLVEINPGGYLASTWVTGVFEAFVPPGTYTVFPVLSPADSVWCQTTPISVTVANPGQTVNAGSFHLGPKNVVDLEPRVHYNVHRPGFNTTNLITVRNNGAAPASNITVKVAMESWLTYLSSNSSGSFANDTVTWVLPSLAGGATAILNFQVNTPVNTLGDPYQYFVEVINSQDVLPANNFHGRSGIVTGSFDPNDKQVWTQDDIPADGPIAITDSVLRYLVRFQNTGTDTAFNVRIQDVIDSNLDMSSMRIIDASHPYLVRVFNYREVDFIFPGILLPDSNTNEPASHGFIEFSLKRKPNLAVGTQIDNRADIYFDFNAPILTNTVSSIICPDASLAFSSQVFGADVSFTNQSTGTLGSFEWDFGDGNNSNMPNPTHTYDSSGTYTVCLNMTDTCGLRSVCDTVSVTVVGISNDYEPAANLSLFPNPNSGTFTMRADWLNPGPLKWRVMDLRGHLLFSIDEGRVMGSWRKEVDLRGLPAGTYMMQLEQNGAKVNRMFTVL